MSPSKVLGLMVPFVVKRSLIRPGMSDCVKWIPEENADKHASAGWHRVTNAELRVMQRRADGSRR